VNGVHDMGGMQGMGPIRHEKNEPVFHETWEGRIYVMDRALRAWRKWSIDEGRHAIELLPPADYLRMSYYERWLERNVALLVKHGLVTRGEIETGKPAPGSEKATPALSAARAAAVMAQRPNFERPDSQAKARFKTGDHVRARKINPAGHTRLPRYARGREGIIVRHHGIFVFPDTNAHAQGEQPRHLYSVRFRAQELWGESAPPRDSVHLDLWESYLTHARG
jgi:nitrile hydratase subunit beta